MKKTLLFLLILFLTHHNTSGATPKSGLNFHGSLYSDMGLQHTVHSSKKDEADFTGMSVFSLNMKNSNRKYGKVEGLFDCLLPYGTMINRYMPDSINGDSANAILELYKLFSFGNAPFLLDLRKLYLSVYLPFADITIGRQIINFGKGFIFSPIDVFSTIELQDINYRRRGTDIATIRIPFSNVAGIDFVSELPLQNRDVSVAAKLFTTLFDIDFSAVAIFRNKEESRSTNNERETVVGATFKGDLGVGYYGEIVSHFLTQSDDVYLETMFGIDYSISNKWFFVAEYLYKQYNWQYSVWGEHNLFGSVRYTINELSSVSGSLIYDVERKTTIGIGQLYYNMLQNVNTIFFIQGSDSPRGSGLLYALRVEVQF